MYKYELKKRKKDASGPLFILLMGDFTVKFNFLPPKVQFFGCELYIHRFIEIGSATPHQW